MINKFGCDWLSVENDDDVDLIEERLSDNGYWEYDRWGIGVYKGKVFIVDVDDSGEEWREMLYCNNVKSVKEVLDIGVECGVFELNDGVYYMEEDCNDEEYGRFRELVGVGEGGKYYSELDEESKI